MREHADLSAMVGFVREHVAEHLCVVRGDPTEARACLGRTGPWRLRRSAASRIAYRPGNSFFELMVRTAGTGERSGGNRIWWKT